jgi:undecaprenyl-diphosphatase
VTLLLKADGALGAWLATYHTPWLDAFMWTLGALGFGGGIWILIALVVAVWIPARRATALQLVLAVLLSQLVVDVLLKPAIARNRPFVGILDARVVGYRPVTGSFPSGHAASSMAAAVVLGYGFRRRAIWFALAALIAISRVYIGVHYPLDVLVGGAIGVAIGVLVTGRRAWYIDRSSSAPASVPR